MSSRPFFSIWSTPMPCFTPIYGWVSDRPNENGKFPVTWKLREARTGDNVIQVPCGKCVGCKMDKARQWAVRCVHEASLYDDNCMITLTFDSQHLPPGNSLPEHGKDFADFMKRLRSRFEGRTIRYFHCGEYGGRYGRPHHHACLFNFDFPDKKKCISESGSEVWTSVTLEELWPFGFCCISDVTPKSAAYVARYSLKKMDSVTQDGRRSEYVTMSRRPGIGSAWFAENVSDVYPKDYLTLNGIKYKPPKYYDAKNTCLNPEDMVKIKAKRISSAKANPDNLPARLRVREKVLKKVVSQMRDTL